jgi:hypothetical protein
MAHRLLAIAGVVLLCSSARAEDMLIHRGTFDGVWHAERAIFKIKKVGPRRVFTGSVELTSGKYKGATFNIHGRLAPDNALTITRPNVEEDKPQISKAGPPKLVGEVYVWKGHTSGAGLGDRTPLFELRIRKR